MAQLLDLKQRLRKAFVACLACQLVGAPVAAYKRAGRERRIFWRTLEWLPYVEKKFRLAVALLQT